MKNKPKIGEPCNGCGICCMAQTCANGAYVMGLVDNLGEYVKGRCPALVQKGDLYQCGILLNPNKYIKNKDYPAKIKAKYFAMLIGSGVGCDELLPNDTEEEEIKLEQIINQMVTNEEWMRKIKLATKIIHGL